MEPRIGRGLVWVSLPSGVSPGQVVEPKIEMSLVWRSPGLEGSPSVEGALVWVVSYLRYRYGIPHLEGACLA